MARDKEREARREKDREGKKYEEMMKQRKRGE